ncbi:MAG: prohibitin family protein [Gammaproteobacteria bacterium]|nr:prohibitin family protein [Gammaproteobacteria bacterium]
MQTKIILGVVAAIAVYLFFSAFVTVNSGHVGVVRTLGAVNPVPLPEGFSFKMPFVDSVEEVDIRLKKADDEATAASRDLQVVSTRVAVQYSLIASVVPTTYQKIGRRSVVEDALIRPAIQESVKAITAQYTAEELVTRRAEVKAKIQEALETFIDDTLQQKDAVGALNLDNVAITDFEFSAEFNRAIEEKVKAEQEALKAENEKVRRVTQAEAAAEERKLAADAEAYQIEQESIARAEAIRREAEALRDNPSLIELRIAEKWDGRLPTFTGGEAIPLLNVDSIQRAE